MAKRSTPSDKILVDPFFVIPEGAEDQFTYSREGTDMDFDEEVDNLDFDISGDSSDFEQSVDYDDGYDDQDGATLETPNTFAVISQVLRRAPGGQQVIDVVIQSEDVAGAVNYEIQVTKA